MTRLRSLRPVATVLLFGGVLSLIAILMVNVIPVIAELEEPFNDMTWVRRCRTWHLMWPNLRKPDTPAIECMPISNPWTERSHGIAPGLGCGTVPLGWRTSTSE